MQKQSSKNQQQQGKLNENDLEQEQQPNMEEPAMEEDGSPVLDEVDLEENKISDEEADNIEWAPEEDAGNRQQDTTDEKQK